MKLRTIGFALLAILVAGLGALAWRLDRGPITVPYLAERIEAAFASGGPPRVEIGTARIGWQGWQDGGIAPLEILLSQLRVLDAAGDARIEVPEARLAIAPGSLLRGDLAPRRVELRDLLLRLSRSAEGGLDPGLGAPAGTDVTGGWVEAIADPSPVSPLAALEHLAVLGGRVIVQDRQLGQDWALHGLFLALRRAPDGGIEGQGSGEVAIGGATVPFRLTGGIEGAPPVARLALSVPHVAPGELARAVPGLALIGILDAPAELSARATFGGDGLLREAGAELRAGPGSLDPPGMGGVPFTALQLALLAGPDSVRLEGLTLRLAPAPDGEAPGPTVTATGLARREGGGWQGRVELALDQARVDALDAWWPRGLAPPARGWVTENLATGLLRDGKWRVEATAPASLATVEMTGLSGGAALEGVAVRWLPGLPPLEGLSGTAEFGLERITLYVRDGRQRGTELLLPAGRLRLSGLGEGRARAELRGRVAGPVGDLWNLLRDPQLGLLEGRDLPVRDPTGAFDAELSGTLPLALRAADPAFRVAARVTELRLPDLVLGRALRDGTFDITLDQDGMRAEGNALLGDIPTSLEVALDFPDAPAASLGLRIDASARVAASRLSEFGFDAGEALGGRLAIGARYEVSGAEPARLRLRADLTEARLALPWIGYDKPQGAEASAEAVLRLREGEVLAIESLRAEGPELELRARTAAAGLDTPLEILEGRIGATRFTGSVRPPASPGEAWQVALRGPVVDLRPLLAEVPEAGAATPAAATGAGDAPPVALELRFDRALTPDPGPPLRALAATATIAGGSAREASISGEVGDAGGSFAGSLAPLPEGGRTLRIEAQDTGRLLAALGFTTPLEGGRLQLAATQAGPLDSAPIVGTAELASFAVRDAPAIGKLLQAFTGYGLLEALSGPGLGFSRLVLPFRIEPDSVVIDDARAFSASLGVTAEGRIDRRQRMFDIDGTIVPAYVFNSLLGHLPLVGRLFSPEAGGGLFSAAFEVRGPLADPRISVNPLTALTPGFLRGLFDLGEAPEPDGPAASAP